MHAREKKSCRLKNRSSAVPTKTRSRGSPRSRPGRASTAPCAAHASTMSGKKMMDEMEGHMDEAAYHQMDGMGDEDVMEDAE